MQSYLCDEFKCLPSALAGEDVAELFRLLEARNYLRTMQIAERDHDQLTPAQWDLIARVKHLRKTNGN